MNVQPEPMPEPEQPPKQEIIEETPAAPVEKTTAPADQDQSFFFPNLLGDGRSISVTSPDRESAEKQAKKQLAQETAQSS